MYRSSTFISLCPPSAALIRKPRRIARISARVPVRSQRWMWCAFSFLLGRHDLLASCHVRRASSAPVANQRHRGKHVLAVWSWHGSYPTRITLNSTHLKRHSELELTTIIPSLQFCPITTWCSQACPQAHLSRSIWLHFGDSGVPHRRLVTERHIASPPTSNHPFFLTYTILHLEVRLQSPAAA